VSLFDSFNLVVVQKHSGNKFSSEQLSGWHAFLTCLSLNYFSPVDLFLHRLCVQSLLDLSEYLFLLQKSLFDLSFFQSNYCSNLIREFGEDRNQFLEFAESSSSSQQAFTGIQELSLNLLDQFFN
jgi:hypothetical protein